MTLRTPSRVWQWTLWIFGAALSVVVYVVVTRILYGDMTGGILSPYSQRVLLPIIAVFLILAWEVRWNGMRRNGRRRAEALFRKARSIRHHSPPDERRDARYLRLLRKAADAGSLRAMLKLGQYAMQQKNRAEADRWFRLAKRHSAHDKRRLRS